MQSTNGPERRIPAPPPPFSTGDYPLGRHMFCRRKMEPPLSVCQRLLKDDDDGDNDDCGPWLVISADQRASLRQRGFVVLDGLAPADLAAEAYEEASFEKLNW